MAQVIKFLWSAHIRTLALTTDISGGAPVVTRVAAVIPRASGNNPERPRAAGGQADRDRPDRGGEYGL
jgi:hypothetical protein